MERKVTYLVIGYYYNSTRKFRDVYSNLNTALHINLWRGKVYEVINNKRRLIRSVNN